MAYTLIATQTLVAPSGTVTFSSIPGTFKDLALECVIRSDRASTEDYLAVRLNADSGTNYSYTRITGSGTSASSERASNSNAMVIDQMPAASSTAGAFATTHMNFQSYSNSNVNKTVLTRNNNAIAYLFAFASLWRSTSAVTSLQIYTNTGSNFVAGSTFKLWGVS